MAVETMGAVLSRGFLGGAEPSRKFSEAFTPVQSTSPMAARGSPCAVPPSLPVESAGSQRMAKAPPPVAKLLDRVTAAQSRLDQALELAQSGRTFSPAELIGLQARVCAASVEIDFAAKAVEKVTGAMKQILQTQV